jgi:5-methylcytosine-specific restriction endonuclease McrA
MRQEDEPFYRLHLEHIVAKQHRGSDDADNLALACHHCNVHKGTNLTAIDPMTRDLVRLFNPRTQAWDDHFELHAP